MQAIVDEATIANARRVHSFCGTGLQQTKNNIADDNSARAPRWVPGARPVGRVAGRAYLAWRITGRLV